ncbi:MAG: serine/threonine protein kinase [Candidatus Helarchaeota archaeon]
MQEEEHFAGIAQGICNENSFSEPSYIGHGEYKEAYLTEIENKFPVALKIFDPDKCNLFRAEREINAMQQCESDFIGKLYGWGIYKTNDDISFLYVLEEYFSEGTLADKLLRTKLNPAQVCDYCTALIKAISHLREKSLVHRDIKPENIMFRPENGHPAIVDFGLVRVLTDVSLTRTHLNHGPGTPFYASPEQLNNEKSLIDWRSDQFSIGVVLGICLTGKHPYQGDGESPIQAVDKVMNRANCCDGFCSESLESGCGFLPEMISPWPIDRFSHPKKILMEVANYKKELTK